MDDKPLLSLCMIVKDEEEALPGCLRSVEQLVDEMIVVDTGSVDHTPEIARRMGAKCYTYPWDDHFGRARNAALEQARGEWILILDADEQIPPAAGKQLRYILSRIDPDVEGITLQIQNRYGGGTADQFALDSACRVFRNRPEYRFDRPLHEEMSQIIRRHRSDARILVTDFTIDHHGYLEDVIQRKEKGRRNMLILAKALAEAPDDPFLNYAYGTEYLQKQEYETAVQYYQKIIHSSLDAFDFGADLYYKTVVALMKMGKPDEGLRMAEQALRQYPDFSALWYVKGEMHYLQSEWEQARSAFAWCLRLGTEPVRYLHIHGLESFHTYWALGKTFEKEGKEEQAITNYISALDADPQYQPAIEGLERIFVRRKERVRQYLDLSMVEGAYCRIYHQLRDWLTGGERFV